MDLLRRSISCKEEVTRANFDKVDNNRLKEEINDHWCEIRAWEIALKLEEMFLKIVYSVKDAEGRPCRVVEFQDPDFTRFGVQVYDYGQWQDLIMGEYKYSFILEKALKFFMKEAEQAQQTSIDLPPVSD